MLIGQAGKYALYIFRMLNRSEIIIYHQKVMYCPCDSNSLQCKRLLLPDVSTPAGLEGYATATGARAVTGFGPWPPVAGFWRYSGATINHKTSRQVRLWCGMSMLAFVSAVVMPQWVLLEQTHVYCTAGHHVASLSHSTHMLPTPHTPHLTGRQRIKLCVCPQPYAKRRKSHAQPTIQVQIKK
jgi:hypothetical protein